MDAWERMFQEEADTLAFLLSEEFKEERIMRKVLSLEQAAQVAAEIEEWKQLHAANDSPVLPNETPDTIEAGYTFWR